MRISTNNITVEDNVNAVEEEENKDEAEKYFFAKHNEDGFKIDFECASRHDNNPIIVIDEREDEEKYVGMGMEVFDHEEESIENTFQKWSQEEIKL